MIPYLLNVWSKPFLLPLVIFLLIFHAASADETDLASPLINDLDASASQILYSSPGWTMTNEDNYSNINFSPEPVLVAGNANCEAEKKARRGIRLSKRQSSESCNWQELNESTPPATGEAGAQPRIDNDRPATEGIKPAENPSGNKIPTPELKPAPKRIISTPIQNPKPIMERLPKDPRRILPGFVEGGNPCNKGFSQVEYSRYKHPVCYPLQQGTVRIAPFGVGRARWQYDRYGMDLKGGFIRDLIWPSRSSELTLSSPPAKLGEEEFSFVYCKSSITY